MRGRTERYRSYSVRGCVQRCGRRHAIPRCHVRCAMPRRLRTICAGAPTLQADGVQQATSQPSRCVQGARGQALAAPVFMAVVTKTTEDAASLIEVDSRTPAHPSRGAKHRKCVRTAGSLSLVCLPYFLTPATDDEYCLFHQ
ncbi:hypothetical protein BD626DRAFT_15811 [Schizophyllum amplum]|uniref:Uncharacterized protein n=1 Tax=Schizophyllum amplum TaxID=97359 RepID=A0A550CXV9_9AGAR|nr:hypothetical protein BD626DRAFT_15811 [Auriculariopsis ampla]